MIRFSKFGGIIPRLNPEQLPVVAAQVAHNCDLTSGAIVPINVQGATDRMHDESTLALLSTVPEADVVRIEKPAAPSINQITNICNPLPWLKIGASDWVSYNSVNGQRIETQVRSRELVLQNVIHTETGLEITAFLQGYIVWFSRDITYFWRGPKYQFGFTVDEVHPDGGRVNGGPDRALFLPGTQTSSDQEFPVNKVPLVDTQNNIYAEFQVTDVVGPRLDEDILVTESDSLFVAVPNVNVQFTINMNYTIANRRFFFYVQTSVNTADQEGPASELSDRITVKPGQLLTLNTPSTGNPTNNLYRSESGGNDFLLVDSLNQDTFIDDNPQLKAEILEPYGNFPGEDEATPLPAASFLEGAFIHPAGYAVAFHGDTVYASDIQRFHSWPDKNTTPFQEPVVAVAFSGNTTLVFTATLVYGISGSNPELLSNYVLSTTTPLLNKLSMCRIGQTVFFATTDGMAAATGSQVKLVTSEHFTRKEWDFLQPSAMRCFTADNSIFIETTTRADSFFPTDGSPISPNSAAKFRLDLEEDLSAASSYTALTGATAQWRSKRLVFDQKTIFDYVRVLADNYASVTLKLYADRVLVDTLAITSDAPVEVTGASVLHAREWEWEVLTASIVRKADLFDRIVHPVGASVQMTPQNTPIWQSTYFKFPDRDTFSAGILSAQVDTGTLIEFLVDGEVIHAVTALNGEPFLIPRTTAAASGTLKETEWLVRVNEERFIDGLQLFRRAASPAGSSLREVNDRGLPGWLRKRYEFADQAEISSVIVHATSVVTMNLYYDGATAATESVVIQNSQEIRVSNGLASSLEFDFGGDDGKVTEVIVLSLTSDAAVRTIGVDALTLSNLISWRRLILQFPDRGVLACGSVGAPDYDTDDDGEADLTLDLYADGATPAVDTRIVADGKIFLFPRTLSEASRWEVDLYGVDRIDSLVLFPRRPVQVEGGIIRMVNPETAPTWLYSRFEFPAEARLASVLANTESTVTMRLYVDGATAPSETISIVTGVETAIAFSSPLRTLEFDFVDDDGELANDQIRELSVFARKTETISPNSPLQLRNRPNWRFLSFKMPDIGSFGVASVGATHYIDPEIGSGAVVFNLSADGLLVFTKTVLSGVAFRIPMELSQKFAGGTQWEVDLAATHGKIESFVMIPKTPVPINESVRALSDFGGMPPWLSAKYEFPELRRLTSGIVHANSEQYPITMNIRTNGTAEVVLSVTIADANEFRVVDDSGNYMPRSESFEVEFRNSDGTSVDSEIRDLSLFAHQQQLQGDEGVTLSNSQNWRGLLVGFPGKSRFVSGSVNVSKYTDDAGADNVFVRVYDTTTSPATLVESKAVTSGSPFVLERTNPVADGGQEAASFEIDVVSTGEVSSLLLFPRARVPVAGNTIREVARDGGFPQWLRSRYQFQDKAQPKSMRVYADSYPVTVRLFVDGATTATSSVVVLGDNEVRLTGLGTVNDLEFDVVTSTSDTTPKDETVNEIVISAKVPESVGGEGVSFSGPSFRSNLVTFADKGVWACGSVSASDYTNLVADLYADGTRVQSVKVRDGGVFAFDRDLSEASEWEVDVYPQSVTSDVEIYNVRLVPWRRQAVEGNDIRLEANENGFHPWLFTWYDFAGAVNIRSGIVHHDESSVQLFLYADGATSSRTGKRVSNNYEFEVPSSLGNATSISIAFQDISDQVNSVALFGEETVPMENRGIVLRRSGQSVPWRNKVLRFPVSNGFGVVRIVADNYTGMTMSLTADGTTHVSNLSVADNKDFKLVTTQNAALPNARDWYLSVSHQGTIHEVGLIGRENVEFNGQRLRISHGEDPFTWLDKHVIAPRPMAFACGRAVASDYPLVLRLYADGKLLVELPIEDETPFRIPSPFGISLRPSREWVIDLEDQTSSGTADIKELLLATSMGRLR